MKFTILGDRGFIGSHMVRHLRQQGIECITPGRDLSSLKKKPLGHVVYAIGLTADFRYRLHETVDAHVALVNDFLERYDFESFLYLSSTRVYGVGETKEDSPILVQPGNPDHVYNLSKLTGESICLAQAHIGVKVARLSNVYGKGDVSENFLTSLMRDAVNGELTFRTAQWSEKDYISVSDVVELLTKVVIAGEERIYNIASGTNVSNQALAETLKQHTGAKMQFEENAPGLKLPAINTERIQRDFDFKAQRLLQNLPYLLEGFQKTK